MSKSDGPLRSRPHQENLGDLRMPVFSFSSAKFGRLWPCEVATWLLKVYFCALLVTYHTSDTLKVIKAFPEGPVICGVFERDIGIHSPTIHRRSFNHAS